MFPSFDFTGFVLQEPGGIMILKAKFEGRDKSGECSDFNPYFGTDTGICAIIKPQLNFNRSLDDLAFWNKIFANTKGVRRGSEVGKAQENPSGAMGNSQLDCASWLRLQRPRSAKDGNVRPL